MLEDGCAEVRDSSYHEVCENSCTDFVSTFTMLLLALILDAAGIHSAEKEFFLGLSTVCQRPISHCHLCRQNSEYYSCRYPSPSLSLLIQTSLMACRTYTTLDKCCVPASCYLCPCCGSNRSNCPCSRPVLGPHPCQSCSLSGPFQIHQLISCLCVCHLGGLCCLENLNCSASMSCLCLCCVLRPFGKSHLG